MNVLNKYLEKKVPKIIIDSFSLLAEQKIKHEGWKGRHKERKKKNFEMCWSSEYAFKEILGDRKIKYAYSGLYVGPVEESQKSDFIVWKKDKKISLGIRSRTYKQLARYLEVSYPDDRLKLEKESISDYIIISSIEELQEFVLVKFYGAIDKSTFLNAYKNAYKKFSPINQESFRLIKVDNFSYELLIDIIKSFDKNNNL